MDIKDRVKLYLSEVGLSYADFAAKAGIQSSTFSHVMNGRNNPSLEFVTKIHEAYNLSLDWLLYGKGEMMDVNSQMSTSDNQLFTADIDVNRASNTSSTYPHTMQGASRMAAFATSQLQTQQVIQQAQALPNKPPRKITEIRIFFDDNTYEIFKPDK